MGECTQLFETDEQVKDCFCVSCLFKILIISLLLVKTMIKIKTESDRSYHRYTMQIEKSQPEGQRIVPESSLQHYLLTEETDQRPMIDYYVIDVNVLFHNCIY